MTGQDIRAFRQRERLSQEALGGVLGVIHSSISNWERGRHIPASHEAKLQELMGASPEGLAELLDGVPRKAEERRKRQCANPVKPQKTSKRETAKICSCTSRQPLQGLPPLAAHGQCEKQDHVLCLHPGDRPCPYLRRGAYIPAAQGAQPAVSGRCQGGGVGSELWAV